jgi:hypothetical protein
MSAPVLPLHTESDSRVAAWILRLNKCEPGTEAARAVYSEARVAGLVDELYAALTRRADAEQREADALRAEIESTENLLQAVRPVMEGRPDMTIGEALQKLGYLRPQ